MAPHDTNTPKEARRHGVPLVGMAAILIAVAIGFFIWVFGVTSGSEERSIDDGAAVEAPD